MSYKRLQKVIQSYLGGNTVNTEDYNFKDALMMLTELAYQMKPETFAFVQSKDSYLNDFLMAIFSLRKEKGIMILNSQKLIDPMYEPKVYEEDGHLAISVKIKGEEIVFFELKID